MTDWNAISARIRELRELFGLTQAELGRRVGSSSNYVAQVEGGLAISEKKLERYAAALEVSVPYLRYGVAEATDLAAVRRAAREQGRAEVLAELRRWVERESVQDPDVVTIGPVTLPIAAVVDRTQEAAEHAAAKLRQQEQPSAAKPRRRRRNG
jgi:transcriptional regulator with XRE-family HTH domain